jgi:hypothetical protein
MPKHNVEFEGRERERLQGPRAQELRGAPGEGSARDADREDLARQEAHPDGGGSDHGHRPVEGIARLSRSTRRLLDREAHAFSQRARSRPSDHGRRSTEAASTRSDDRSCGLTPTGGHAKRTNRELDPRVQFTMNQEPSRWSPRGTSRQSRTRSRVQIPSGDICQYLKSLKAMRV